ncbi:hypothetical protein AOLI_G00092640 [Acnodon oligacanthus]
MWRLLAKPLRSDQRKSSLSESRGHCVAQPVTPALPGWLDVAVTQVPVRLCVKSDSPPLCTLCWMTSIHARVRLSLA